jgi:hypothetical protein
MALKKKSAAPVTAAPVPPPAPAVEADSDSDGIKRPRINLEAFDYAVWTGGRIPEAFVKTIDEVKAVIAANPGKKINVFKRVPLKIEVNISL